MTLVRIRCRRCHRVLATVDEWQAVESRRAGWSGCVEFGRCRRCDLPDPRRVVGVMSAQGVDAMPLNRRIDYAELRPHVERALRLARTIDLLT